MKDMTKQLSFSAVPTEVVDVVWPQAKDLLQKAIDVAPRAYNLDYVYDKIKDGTYGLWLVMDETVPVAAITTRVSGYPTGAKCLALDWIGGERMFEWLPMVQKVMESYARDNDCTHLEGYGREAWGRALKKFGWETDYISYKMELTDGRV
jgi:hypothetical protein